MVIKAIFLDFDGTISDAHNIAYTSLVKTLDKLQYNYDKKKAYKALGNKMNIILEKLNIEVDNLKKFRKKFYSHFIYAAKNGGISPCVDLEPLKELSKKYPLYIISNSETKFLKASIDKLKLRGIFRKVYGAEKFNTKDEILKKLFLKMNIKPREAIYIGDRFSDVVYSKKAHCVSVAIHNKCSWSSLKEIKAKNPDYIIKDFKELTRVIQKIK